jgi:hypothetical protein
MALGILEPTVEHVPGTVYVYESEQRHAELLENARHLKKDKTGRIILVPQPSGDPNDPLVCLLRHCSTMSLLTPLVELASLAARRDPRYLVLRILPRYHRIPSTGRGFGHACNSIQANISGCGPAYSLPPLRRLCGGMALCCIGKSMGQTTSVSVWGIAHGCEFGLGWL